MNLWILKYDTQDFSSGYIEELENYVITIPQLANNEKLKFEKGKFHFLSFHSKGTPKSYNQNKSMAEIEKPNYDGRYNDIGSMIKSLNEISKT